MNFKKKIEIQENVFHIEIVNEVSPSKKHYWCDVNLKLWDGWSNSMGISFSPNNEQERTLLVKQLKNLTNLLTEATSFLAATVKVGKTDKVKKDKKVKKGK